MRLLIVSRMFDQVVGGVERSAINLMNAMVDRGHEVSLFTWDKTDATAFYPMSESIRWCQLDMGHAERKAGTLLRLKRMHKFRRFIRSRQPDVVLGFQHGAYLFAEVGLLGSGIPVVLAERNAPDRFDYLRAGRYRRWVFQSMRPAAAITVQCDSYVGRYPSYLRSHITVIPNPVFEARQYAAPGSDKTVRTLLSVGRLSYQKNYPVLIRAFARICADFPEWRLKIVGEGDDRSDLESLRDGLELGHRVSMDGVTRNVAAEYQEADLFCLPSRWEGFPNTVAEAMAHGLPAIAFADCAGMADLISPGHNGQLAGGNGDPESLARTLSALMGDAEARNRMGKTARDIVRIYDPEKMYDRWERLFRKVKVVG